MISCLNEVTMQAYFDGELEPGIAAQVNKHLAKCDDCAASAFEFERAIELMAGAFEDELPDSIPSERLRVRLAGAIAGELVPARVSTSGGFWRRILDAPAARWRLFGVSSRRLAYASFGVLALVLGLWLGLRTGLFVRKQEERVQNNQTQAPTPPSATPGEQPESDSVARQTVGTESKSGGAIAGALKSHRGHSPSAKERAGVEREVGLTLPDERDNPGEWLAGTADAGIFDAATVRHFEKAEMLLRSFRNSDSSGERLAADLDHEKRQSKSLLYQNILLRRDAENSGNLPAEEVLSSLEPVLLDIANLPDRPSSEEVRSIKDRIHKKEIIGVLQVYSTPLTAASYQPY